MKFSFIQKKYKKHANKEYKRVIYLLSDTEKKSYRTLQKSVLIQKSRNS